MRARLTTIALQVTNDRRLEVGDIVVGGEDLPIELLQARLDAGTAELVSDGPEPSTELVAAIDAYIAALDQAHAAGVAAADLALAGSAGSAMLLLYAVHERLPAGAQLAERMQAVMERAELDQQHDTSPEGSPAQGEAEAGSVSAASEAGAEDGPAPAEHSKGSADAPASGSEASPLGPSDVVGNATSSDGAGAGDPPASDVPGGVEQRSARLAHNQEVGGSNPSPAPTDASQPQAGMDGDAAGAPASAAEPAAPSDPASPAEKPARKGGKRGT